MKKVNPKNPVRADYRMLRDILSKQGEDVQHIASEYEAVLKVFKRLGGSWEKVFKGSPDDIVLLKKVCKKAIKVGVVSRGGFSKSQDT